MSEFDPRPGKLPEDPPLHSIVITDDGRYQLIARATDEVVDVYDTRDDAVAAGWENVSAT